MARNSVLALVFEMEYRLEPRQERRACPTVTYAPIICSHTNYHLRTVFDLQLLFTYSAKCPFSQIRSHMNKKQNTEGLRNSSTSDHLYCAPAAGVSREVTKASDKQQTMYANLVNCLHIKSTGCHKVLHHGQLALLGCQVQGCVSIIIRVKEVALHYGGKVLSNGKMATTSTQVKGIAPFLQ